jgi:hypothetical protein
MPFPQHMNVPPPPIIFKGTCLPVVQQTPIELGEAHLPLLTTLPTSTRIATPTPVVVAHPMSVAFLAPAQTRSESMIHLPKLDNQAKK